MSHDPKKPTTLEQMADVFGYELKRRPLRPPEVSDMTGLAVATLQDQRHDGTGIRYFKQGKFVYYSERDVLEWLIAGERYSTTRNPAQLAAA